MIDATQLACGLAAHDLGGQSRIPEALRDRDATTAIAAAARSNLLGLLGDLVATGEIAAPAAVAEQIHRAAVDRLIADMRLERACSAVVSMLATEGIPVRVLKGVATAHLDHPHPGHRSTSDVDLLVRGEDLHRAQRVIGTLGYQRDLPERREGFDRWFAKDITFFASDRPELDLHRTLIKGPYGLAFDPGRAFEDGEPLVLGGSVGAVALSAPWRLLHSCLVVGAGDAAPSMGMLRDLALQSRRPGLDRAAFEQLVETTRSAEVVRSAWWRVERTLGLELPAGVEARGAPRWWLRAYAAHGGTDVTAQVGAVLALPWRQRGPYLWALAIPGRRYRRARSAAGRASATRLLLGSLPRRGRRDDRRAEAG